jgi:hypothetical protein
MGRRLAVSRGDDKERGRREAEWPGPIGVTSALVAFFAGHTLHRSHTNRSADRFRRSFVGHYANARSSAPRIELSWDLPAGAGEPVGV